MSKIYDAKSPGDALGVAPVAERSAAVAEATAGKTNGKTESFAQYDLLREIGRGALSVVYEARHNKTGQKAALKLLTFPDSLPPQEAADLAARFERQARAVARLSHPNVVRVYEVGVEEGRHFIAMEYLRGQTLRDRLKQGILTTAEAVPILTQLASGLDAFHEAGIAHRDIKPTNIILLPGGAVKLLDFGIAPPAGEAAASAGVVLGSPSYMAPEQVKGEIGTGAADIWALGVLTYEMFTGALPFAGKTAGAVLYQVVHQPPAPVPALPPAVQRVLRRALDKRPTQRYPAASALIRDLNPAAPRPSVTEEASVAFSPKPSVQPATPPWTPTQKAAPKPAAKEPLPTAAAPEPAAKSTPAQGKPAASRSLSRSPRLLGAGFAVLFLIGFSGASLLRHQTSSAVQNEVVSPVAPLAAPRPAQASVPATLPVVQPAPLKAASPKAVAVLHEANAAGSVSPTPLKRRTEAMAQAKPVPVQVPTPLARPVAPPASPRRAVAAALRKTMPLAAQAARVQVATRHVPVSVATLHVPAPTAIAALPVRVRVASQHIPAPRIPVQRIESYHSEVQRAPAPTVVAPVQNTAPGFTLPSSDSADDPEAEARLRKSAWSQSGTVGTP